jgi:hypothetical protein
MPRGDGTGPAGMGPMTGRAAGYCAGYPVPGYMNPYGGRLGLGFGWGRGRLWGYPYSAPFGGAQYGPFPYAAPYSRDQEKEALQNQVKVFEDQIAAIQKRIGEIEADASKESK